MMIFNIEIKRKTIKTVLVKITKIRTENLAKIAIPFPQIFFVWFYLNHLSNSISSSPFHARQIFFAKMGCS
jgi:hypothetical protein